MGRLQVTVCAARKLHDNQVVGIPDPYAKVRLGNIHFKTKVIDNSLNPVWNETFTFQVADDSSAQLGVELWNDNIISDDLMGLYTLSVGNLTRGVVVDNWFVLTKCKTNAELHMRVLAVDFGKLPEPSDQWKVTTDINNDPQLMGTKPGDINNAGNFGKPGKIGKLDKPDKLGKPAKVEQYGGSSAPPVGEPVYGIPVQPVQPAPQPTYPTYTAQPAYGAPAPPQPAHGGGYGGYPPPPQPYSAPPQQPYGGGYSAPPPQPAYGAPSPPEQYGGGRPDLPVPMGGVGPIYPSAPPPQPYHQPPPPHNYPYHY